MPNTLRRLAIVLLCAQCATCAQSEYLLDTCLFPDNVEALQFAITNETRRNLALSWNKFRGLEKWNFNEAYLPNHEELHELHVDSQQSKCSRSSFTTRLPAPSFLDAVWSDKLLKIDVVDVTCVYGRHVKTSTKVSKVPIIRSFSIVSDLRFLTGQCNVSHSLAVEVPWFAVPLRQAIADFIYNKAEQAVRRLLRTMCNSV